MVAHALCHKIELKQVERIQTGACSMEQSASIDQILTDYIHIAMHYTMIVPAMAEVHADSYRIHSCAAMWASKGFYIQFR